MRAPISLRPLFALLAVASLAGCMATAPRVAVLEPTTVRPEPTTATAAAAAAARAPLANGAIYHPSSHRGLFEDRRARLVGDLLTIQIQEKTTARSSSNSSVDRKANADGSISRLPFVPQTSSLMPKLGVAGESNNAFEGKGATGSENLFTGTITVTVVEVLPNGNLVVSGEKQVGINQNVEALRFSGVVNPATVLPGNIVSSTQVADARLEVRGRGDIDRAQTVGWLTRFFLSFLPI
ncbi:MAG: flagellar basal body L-ring protein FlgH [Burkholderiales bacterium]|jgi:flagellar L-ring protein precursor FlgH|nr:flagellar basal body L-ring protein FlgH [Burkholderiales bacterium]MEB2353076.1 flagellar basal body L-ring protein FlgH [Burkholderiaceae bacterium]HMM51031.1 flagellar basal body L-ring protein FlgH [Burkholderiaceae bacterium]